MHQQIVNRRPNRGPAAITRRRFLAAAGALPFAGRFRLAWAPPGPDAPAQKPRRRMIDAHLHIHHQKRTLEDTVRHIEATGADKAIILPLETGEGGVVLTTDAVLEAFHKYPDRIIPFCQCDVRSPNARHRIRRYRELGCRGFGEQKEHVPLNHPGLESVIALCDELNWPITMHFQDGEKGYNQGLADHLEGYLKKYKRVRILAHAQTWWAHISAEVPPPE